MILVINLNASVDKKYEMEKLNKGEVMRAKRCKILRVVKDCMLQM